VRKRSRWRLLVFYLFKEPGRNLRVPLSTSIIPVETVDKFYRYL